MDFRAILSSPITLKELILIKDEILKNPTTFSEVFEFIFEKTSKWAWRAAWAIEKVSEADTSFFSEKEILRLMELSVFIQNDGLKRAVLAILINLPIPENLPVEFINVCFERMISMRESVAVQALSMQMLLRIGNKIPELIPEILVTLENMDLTGVSAGYLAIRKKTMKALTKKMDY